jgi:hypothetical protein
MKKFLFSLIIVVSCSSIEVFSQTNLFPQTGNVGIGTTTPTSPLHLMGNLTLQGLSTSNYIPTLFFKRYSDGTPIFSIGYKNPLAPNSFFDFNSLNGNPISFSMVNVERMSILENGNVGIGTLSPTEKLSIYGTNNVAPGVMSFESSREDVQNAEVGILKAKNSGVEITKIGLNRAGGSNTGFLNFWVKKTNETALYEAMRISENGNVGIGTTTPSTKLHIDGGLRITDFFAMGNNQFQWFKDASGSERRLIGLSGTNIAYFGDVDNTITGSMNLFQANSQHRFFTNGSEKLTVIQNGNVGIGTINPTEKLEVNGNIRIYGQTIGSDFVSGGTNSWVFHTPDDGRKNMFIAPGIGDNGANGWDWSKSVILDNNGQMQVQGSISILDKFSFNAVGNSFLNGGNVGVGTAQPNEPLEVAGTGRIFIGNGGGLSRKGILIDGMGDGTFVRLHPYNYGENKSLNLVILPFGGGNVGIGTTTPTGKFEISSSDGSAKFKIGDAAGNSINHLSWNTGAAINVPDQGGANPLIYFRRTDYNNLNNFTDVFQVKSDGSIQAFGQVRGSDMISTGTNSWIFHTPDDGRKNMFIAPGLGASDGSAGWDWGKGMVLNNDGSVGISANTVPTGYKLAVGGDMIAERVVVKLQSNWPDYVFSPNYKRSTLTEVEEYINKNHHLPNIPSAQEIADNGIDVGKMNAKLLEKMEEMTLYMIEQQKEIKALREEVKQIKNKK